MRYRLKLFRADRTSHEMPLPKIRVGIELSFKSNSVSKFDLDLTRIEYSISRQKFRRGLEPSFPFVPRAVSSPNARKLASRVPDAAEGENW